MKSKAPVPAPTIGVIGLGIMGLAIAGHLVQGGHRVVGFDVRALRRRALRAAGGAAAGSAGEIGRLSDVVITSLPSADALVETTAALSAAGRPPRIVVETSTLPIAIKQRTRRT